MSAAAIPFEAVPTPDGGPLVVELVPAPDPWDVARRLAHLPHLLFLDSADRHDQRGRYCYVTGAEPHTVLIRPTPVAAAEDPFDTDHFDCPPLTRPDAPE